MVAAPFAFALPLADRALFGLGLFLTYASIGVLVALLPRVGPRRALGLAVGLLDSLPGSVLVAVPYPLREDVHVFYRNFAEGVEELVMTLVYGATVGLVCEWTLPRTWPHRVEDGTRSCSGPSGSRHLLTDRWTRPRPCARPCPTDPAPPSTSARCRSRRPATARSSSASAPAASVGPTSTS